jgi:hypothetical protein
MVLSFPQSYRGHKNTSTVPSKNFLSTSFGAENITFVVVADCNDQVSEQKALARESRLEASVSAVKKYNVIKQTSKMIRISGDSDCI